MSLFLLKVKKNKVFYSNLLNFLWGKKKSKTFMLFKRKGFLKKCQRIRNATIALFLNKVPRLAIRSFCAQSKNNHFSVAS